MNIAHCVESYAPALGGMPEVVRQLSERMVRMGHRVTVFTSTHPARTGDMLNGVRIRSFPLSGNAVRGIQGDTGPYRRALIDGGFDVVVFFAAQQWATDAMLPHLADLKACKVFVPTGFSGLHEPAYADHFRAMPAWLRAMDLNVFLSHTYQDIRFAQEHGVTRLTVIPNGAAEEEFEASTGFDLRAAHRLAPDDRIVLHVGSYTGIKGHREALRIFIAADTPRTVLVFIGNGVKDLERHFHRHRSYFVLRWLAWWRRKRILFLEADRPDTVAAMRQADLFLFPSLVECSPIVLFETMAAGVPFLSSTAGNAEEIVEWAHGGRTVPGTRDARGRIHPDIAAGARALTAMLNDPERLRAAGAAGHRAWKERFTWQRIAERYVEEYQRLVHRDA